jgi:hypothetical protein
MHHSLLGIPILYVPLFHFQRDKSGKENFHKHLFLASLPSLATGYDMRATKTSWLHLAPLSSNTSYTLSPLSWLLNVLVFASLVSPYQGDMHFSLRILRSSYISI